MESQVQTSGCRSQESMNFFELLIVLTIIMVIMAIALPQMLNLREDYRLTVVDSELVGYASNARILAITKNSDFRVTVFDSDTYAIQEDISGTWTTDSSYDLPGGFQYQHRIQSTRLCFGSME
jgi:Tfp pilus assembly protein FimT